ncbi:glycosyltransferase family 39 protein [Haloarcula sebkhae]|uniref:Glycosyltransferase family 39 protein n=1 Tax=Haloarcula sebkhae TaxID=932660 RepID=A0ACC6VLB8_9EURY|nr:glycosyltransferase family 39 protein [Haloarcula sebkhae]
MNIESLERSLLNRRSLHRDWLVIFILALTARLADWFLRGTRVVGDATTARRICNELSVSTLITTNHRIIYSGFQLPYCAFLRIPGTSVDLWIFLQILLSAASCILIYETGRLLVSRNAGLIGGLLFAVIWQVFKWNVRPQSEPLFAIIGAVVLWRLAVYDQYPTHRNQVLALIPLLWLAITRPNGLAIILGYLLLDTIFVSDRWRINVFPYRYLNLFIILCVGILAVFRLFAFDGVSMMERLAKGLIVTGHIYYEYTPTAASRLPEFLLLNSHHIAIIIILRVLWFFSPILPAWSVPHIIIGLATVLPVNVGGIIGGYRALMHDSNVFKYWGVPVLMALLLRTIAWVPGGRNWFSISAVCLSLLTGYLLHSKLPSIYCAVMNGE